MESHDEERIMYKNLNFGNNTNASYNVRDLNIALKRTEMSATFLLTMPGPKMFWEFGEMGYDYSINRCTDGSINNNCRLDPKPIQWDYLQQVQRLRLHDIYASLLKLRAHGWYKDVFIANNTTINRNMSSGFKWLLVRSATDSSMMAVIGNFDVTSQTGSFTFPSAGRGYDYLRGVTFSATGGVQNITLQPGEYHIYLNRNLVNAVTTPVTNINPTNKNFRIVVYPNPIGTNPSTIEVEVPANGKAEIDLWNTMGQKIATVYSGLLTRGVHTLPLVQGNKRLSAGNYLLRLQQNTKTETEQFILQ